MGSVFSTCKRKKSGKNITIIYDECAQTMHPLSNVRDGFSSYRCHHYLPLQQHMQRRSMSHHRSIVFNKPSSGNNSLPSRCSNRLTAQASTRTTTDRTNPPRVTSASNIVQHTSRHEHRTLPIHTKEQSNKQNFGYSLRLRERSTSIPIDMFLIDISSKNVPVGQPVSMHIRHLLLEAPDNSHANSSVPVGGKPTSTTTDVYENLLNHIPDVCDKFPNLTVDSDQPTRSTLHARLPPRFSHTKT
jgi:hypothetical protein